MKNDRVSLNNFGESDVLEWGSILIKGLGLISALKQALSNLQLEDKITQLLNNKIFGTERSYYGDSKQWFVKGFPCEILKSETPGWQQGKVKLHLEVKIKVEFCPDESELEKPESPLDEFR